MPNFFEQHKHLLGVLRMGVVASVGLPLRVLVIKYLQNIWLYNVALPLPSYPHPTILMLKHIQRAGAVCMYLQRRAAAAVERSYLLHTATQVHHLPWTPGQRRALFLLRWCGDRPRRPTPERSQLDRPRRSRLPPLRRRWRFARLRQSLPRRQSPYTCIL